MTMENMNPALYTNRPRMATSQQNPGQPVYPSQPVTQVLQVPQQPMQPVQRELPATREMLQQWTQILVAYRQKFPDQYTLVVQEAVKQTPIEIVVMQNGLPSDPAVRVPLLWKAVQVVDPDGLAEASKWTFGSDEQAALKHLFG